MTLPQSILNLLQLAFIRRQINRNNHQSCNVALLNPTSQHRDSHANYDAHYVVSPTHSKQNHFALLPRTFLLSIGDFLGTHSSKRSQINKRRVSSCKLSCCGWQIRKRYLELQCLTRCGCTALSLAESPHCGSPERTAMACALSYLASQGPVRTPAYQQLAGTRRAAHPQHCYVDSMHI